MPPISISESLHQLVHGYKSRLRESIRQQQFSLPITHIRVLKGICRNPECTAQSIGQRMQRDKAQITRVLNELLQEGLISKIDNPADGRSQLLRPSPAGEKLMAQLNALENKTIATMTQNLTTEDIATFVQIANTMADNLHRECTPQSGDCPHE